MSFLAYWRRTSWPPNSIEPCVWTILVFRRHFCIRNPSQEKLCRAVQITNPPQEQNTLKRNNYDTSGFTSECALKERLQVHEESVLYYTGNTYPCWPDCDHFDPALFHHIYHPTSDLLQYLPQSKPPHTVVHLRQAGGDLDSRPGLDNNTLNALGKELSNDVFLVTNRVAWYDFFQPFRWSYPPLSHIQHSALHFSWGDVGPLPNKNDQNLQLWANWYTLLQATTIYHTPSDFSKSAARWNRNIISWTILGPQNATNANP